MKANRIAITVLLVLFSAGSGLWAQSDSSEARPYIGILMDPAPLPRLLVKHLGLSPDQGIRIQNVHRGGPADKAGLERDDIIIGFEGEDVVNSEAFVDQIRKAGVGTAVSLEIIHLGKRKPVTLTLEVLEGGFDLKYPPEPEIVQSWRPGKIFRLKPGDENWMEMLQDNLNSDFDVNIKKFFNELHTYHHSNGEDYTITIEGNPKDGDTKITVQAGDKKYETTVGEIDALPEKYREPAEEAVKSALESPKTKRFDITIRPDSWQMPHDLKPYIEKLKPYQNFQMPFEPGGPMFDRIQKQLKELQRRLDRLEKGREKSHDVHEPEKEESEDHQDSAPSEAGERKRA